MQKSFTPWLKQLTLGLALICCGLAVAYLARSAQPYLAVAGLVLSFVGVVLVQRAAAREHGQRVERQATKELTRLAGRWGVRIEHNVPLRQGGDLDVLATTGADTRFAIEIKAQEAVKIKRGFFGAADKITRATGQRFERDPCDQVMAAARQVNAVPVLWFPKSRSSRTDRLNSGVIVVQGGHRQLRRALGVGSWWML